MCNQRVQTHYLLLLSAWKYVCVHRLTLEMHVKQHPLAKIRKLLNKFNRMLLSVANQIAVFLIKRE